MKGYFNKYNPGLLLLSGSLRENNRINNRTLEVASSGGGCSSNITLDNSLSSSAHRHRFATLSCLNSNNVNNREDGVSNNNQFVVNRQQQEQEHNQRQPQRTLLCRTPPPNYHSLPSTPPPSYTPRQQLHQLPFQQIQQELPTVRNVPENCRQENVNDVVRQEQPQRNHYQEQQLQTLRRCQVPEAFALPNEGHRDLSRLNVERQNINEPVIVNREATLANGRCATRNVATVSQQKKQLQQHERQHQKQQQEIQQRRRKQRRRNLYLLQQQQQQQLQQQKLNNLYLGHHTTDSEDSTSLTDISESENDIIFVGNTRNQRRRRRQRLLKLRDAYCPDLLNACSLILLQQQTSDSTVGSFTDTPPPPLELLNDSTDYVEINEFHQSNIRRNGERNENQSISQIYEQIYPYETDTYATYINRLNGGGGGGGATERDEREEEDEDKDEAEADNADGDGNREEEKNQRLYYNNKQEMGQNLSIRRPRISLTWVLREQSQNQQQQQQQENESQQQQNTKKEEIIKEEKKDNITDLNNVLNNNEIVTNQSLAVEKKKYRLKKIPGNSEPLNGYATTPTAYTNTPTTLGTQKFFSNQNLLEYHKDDGTYKPASKDLLFVCTPQHAPDSFVGSTMDALALAKKRNEIRKKLATKMAHFRSESQASRLVSNISNEVQLKKGNKSSLKSGSYSEPSLVAASEGNSRRHRQRKRRERNRNQKFGYEIKNVDEFLNKCSLTSPGNIPMVLSTSCILYQTRPGGYQTEISLPLGMVVNAVFKNQNWLYVQTPHAEEGYVNYTACLPLGILPPEARKESSNQTKPTPCWETNGDIFPKPCGNMTDSEKEIHLRVGSRSEGARTPHLKNTTTDNTDTATIISVKTENTDCLNGNAYSIYGEQQVDKLYLRAASQPKLNEKTSYAQLKIIRNHSSAKSQSSNYTNDEYVTLHQHQQLSSQQQQQQNKQKHVHANQPIRKTYITRTFITNGHNGQHLHPKDMKINLQMQQQQQQQQPITNCNLNTTNIPTTTSMLEQNNTATTITITSYPANKYQQLQTQTQPQSQSQSQPQHQSQSLLQHNQQQQQQHTFVAPRSVLNAIRRSTAHCGQRQTLVAITVDYKTDALTLQKGDIVTLCECRETKDHRQWFFVRTRDGRQGYIPAEVAGHGYL